MHILLIHQAFVSLDDAGGTRHFEICSKLAERGHRVTVITSPINYLSGKAAAVIESDLPFRILRTNTKASLHRSFFSRLVNFFSFMVSAFFIGLVKVRKVDVVWGTTPPLFQTVAAWLVARFKGAKFVLEVRDLWPVFAIDTGVLKSPTLISLSYWLERFIYRRADAIVVNSPGFIEYISAKTSTPITLIANGVDVSMFDGTSANAALKQQLGLADKFVVMYSGAHGLANDLGVVLNAAAQLRDNPQVQFVLVGDGKEKPALMSQAQSLGLTNITFLPPVSKRLVAETLSIADACLAILQPIPMFRTTYPNKVFDYMAAGKPVILAIDGAIREVVEAAGCGIAIQPGNADELVKAILRLQAHPELALTMGEAGRVHVINHFDRSLAIDRFEQLFLGFNR